MVLRRSGFFVAAQKLAEQAAIVKNIRTNLTHDIGIGGIAAGPSQSSRQARIGQVRLKVGDGLSGERTEWRFSPQIDDVLAYFAPAWPRLFGTLTVRVVGRRRSSYSHEVPARGEESDGGRASMVV
jgi:hypothetical protein